MCSAFSIKKVFLICSPESVVNSYIAFVEYILFDYDLLFSLNANIMIKENIALKECQNS